jgi:hypothetical protein
MKARHAYLTLIGNSPTLNIVLDSQDTEVMCIEITDFHLSNIVQDGVKIAFRPDKRRPVRGETCR